MQFNVNRNKPMPLLILTGLVLFVTISIMLSFGISILVNNDIIEINQIAILSFAAAFISSLIGTLYLLKMQKEKVLLPIVVEQLAMIGCMMTCGMLFFDGISYKGWGIALAVILGGVVGMITNFTKSKKINYSKYRSR